MLDTIRKPIETPMARFEEARRALLVSDNPLLGAALSRMAARTGKMMRPMLTLLMDASGGEAVTHAALALELLHTASLVHDDVVDSSDRRRGQRSVNAEYGNQAAVLVGDYILSLALSESARTGSTDFVGSVARLGQQLSDGELLQLANMDSADTSEAQYYEVIRRKTASLFATCAAAPAILQGADHTDVYRLGELIGTIFQMRDDILDITGSTATGKPCGNDLCEGKLTLPVIHVLALDPALRPAAMRVRSGDATEADRQSLTEAAREAGVPYAEDEIERFAAAAHQLADTAAPTPAVATALHEYVRYTAHRNN